MRNIIEEDKLFELLSKMYSEMNSRFDEMNSRMNSRFDEMDKKLDAKAFDYRRC